MAAQDYAFSFLGNDGNRYWSPTDINERGQISGTIGYSHMPTAVTWDASQPGRINYLPSYADCCTYIASWANAINDRGQIAGIDTYRAAVWNGNTRPVLLSGEVLESTAYDLNNAGSVVGTQGGRAVMWSGGSTRVLGTLGGESAAYAINQAGTAAGFSVPSIGSAATHAAVWQGDTLTDLGSGVAHGLNDHGWVVGQSGQRATLWHGTQATFLAGVGTEAFDVNNRGWVVGSRYDDAGDPTSALLWRDGQTIDLNSFLSQAARDEGWRLVSANAINERGWIVGTAFNTQQYYGSGFVLSIPAVPEPASLGMLVAGLAVLGVVARRSRAGASG